jgi:hypothetical protein
MAPLPEYLISLLAQPWPRSPAPIAAPIEPGDIRMCEGGGLHHFVLVLDTHERHVNIALLTDDIDMASDQTPILSVAMTALPFKLLATNLIGPVWPHQLGPRHAHLSEIAAVRRMVMGDWSAWAEHPYIARGLPFTGRGWRWTAHEEALGDLQALCSGTVRELLGED